MKKITEHCACDYACEKLNSFILLRIKTVNKSTGAPKLTISVGGKTCHEIVEGKRGVVCLDIMP